MGKLRYIIALWAAKFSIILLKITRHNGTNFPGAVALKLCPQFLKYASKPERIIGVTGTNGKTTVCNLIVDMLAKGGKKVLDNRLGSNINSGIATSLIQGSTIFGKCKYDEAVFEIDERSALRIFPYVKPEILVITNIFRDSMKRNAHTEYIAGILSDYIPKETKLILNADDLISVLISPENPRRYFGIEEREGDVKECINRINDMQICPKCQGKLSYDYLRYHHIGKARCMDCGYESPAYDYAGADLNMADMTMVVKDKDGQGTYHLISDGIHNIYNMVTVIALFRELGYDHETIARLMGQVNIVKTRYEEIKSGDVTVVRQMAKENNALGSSRAFDYISSQEGNKELLLMMNCLGDEKHWSENTCWLYDCDFEFLNKEDIKSIIVTGPRCKDYELRLLIAGVDPSKIKCTRYEIDAPELLDYTPGDRIYVFHGTDSIVLGEKVLNKVVEIAKERGQK